MRKLLSHPVTLRTRRIVKTALVIFSVVFAVLVVTSITVDLGPLLRHQAERGASYYMKGRPVHIGRLAVHLASGHYVLEDFVVEGLTPQSRPWLRAKRIEISMPWSTLFDHRVVLDAIDMTDWDMYVEMTKDGHNNFPSFRTSQSNGPKRWTTTLQYVHAYRGQFTFDDQGTPWQVITRNLDVTVAKPADQYRGSAKFSNGTVAFQQYVPFRIDMSSDFKIEDGKVKFDRLQLDSTGARSQLTGIVDLGHWPEQTYQLKSKLDFPTQKGIWFANDKFTVSGNGDFVGTFHLFKQQLPDGHSRTGRELKGTLTAPLTGVNRYRFGDLKASVLWVPEKLEVSNATTTVYGGTSRFSYLMAIGQNGARTRNTFDATYKNVDLTALSTLFDLQGIQLDGRVTGHHLVTWPLGRWSELQGNGEAHLTPPEGVALMTKEMPLSQLTRRYEQPKAFGPFSAHLPQQPVPVGGDVVYNYGPEWIEVAPSRIATPETYVEMEGQTAYGERSRLPFHVSSSDWQESDRLFAGILTAFGSHTNAIQVGGYGTFDGVMLNAFKDPRIEGMFAGERMNAFDVDWGSITGNAVIENSYADVKDIVVRSGDSTMNVDGRFSLGYPRRDNGEEINAHIRIANRPVVDLRHAFELDDYNLDGLLTGDFNVTGHYEMPVGTGTMQITNGVAYGEPFATASAGLTFEGDGVALNNIQIAKGTGSARGSAVVRWNGTYSFSIDGRDLPLESLSVTSKSPLPISGLVDFSAGGSGAFSMPVYNVHARIRDVFLKDEGVGLIVGDIGIEGNVLTLNFDATDALRLSVHGSGRVALDDALDTDVTFTVTDSSLDPYVRAYDPRLSPFTTAVVSGSVHVVGSLADIDNLVVDTVVDKLDARLFDYELRNPCPQNQATCDTREPIRIALDRHSLRVTQMRLVGDGTALDINGVVRLHDGQIKLDARGDANLAVLQGFFANVSSSGRAALEATLEGAIDDPAVSGTLRIENGRLRYFALPRSPSLENIAGTVHFDARGVTLDGLTARLGDGPVQFFGRIDKDGYLPGRLDVQMTGQGLTTRFPDGMRSRIDEDLRLQGTLQGATLSGQVWVSDALYSKDFNTDILSFVGSNGAPVASGGGGALQETLPVRYDVHILAPPESLRVQNNLLRIAATADLNLRGTYDRPTLLGTTEINRGELQLLGRRYLVTQGSIDFNNPAKIEPFLDLEVQTRARAPQETYVVTLRVAGTPSHLGQLDLSSDPPLPTPQILALLFSDVTPNGDIELQQYRTSNTTQQQLVRQLATLAVTESVSSRVGRAVQQTFGVDTFQLTPTLVDPNAQSARLDPAARVVIGQRITDRVYLTYSRSLSSTSRDQIIELEYDQSDRFQWILSRNEDRTYAIDVRVKHVY
ncbi:MAG TPA: translocation/assembly module TamB domain-containing protein [Vicinamibacterales bacterium]|nr:translocation/assembly module TamB domain-containing protein [Vicinamibacterales bacterium]